ncbi:MAG: Gfo/Idh/MocA family oxidoreductase [Planctomycetota bacterium]
MTEHVKTIGIALIGSGYIAHYHARGLLEQPGVEIRALCSLDGEVAEEFAEKYGIKKVTDEIESLLGSEEIDAAIICTPNRLHAPFAVDFMEHGHDVFVEKPMALNTAEGRQMIQSAEKSQRIVMVGHMWRFDIEVNYIRELVRSGRIGNIVKTKGYGIHVNWGPDGWFTQKDMAGGGALADMGVHAIDTVRYILGDLRPMEVYAKIGTYYGNYDVDDTGVVIITWETGTVSIVESGWWHPHADGPEASTQLFGTKGYASLFPTGYKLKAGEKLEEHTFEAPPRQEHCDQVVYTRQMQHFIECVRTRKEPAAGVRQGRLSSRFWTPLTNRPERDRP